MHLLNDKGKTGFLLAEAGLQVFLITLLQAFAYRFDAFFDLILLASIPLCMVGVRLLIQDPYIRSRSWKALLRKQPDEPPAGTSTMGLVLYQMAVVGVIVFLDLGYQFDELLNLGWWIPILVSALVIAGSCVLIFRDRAVPWTDSELALRTLPVQSTLPKWMQWAIVVFLLAIVALMLSLLAGDSAYFSETSTPALLVLAFLAIFVLVPLLFVERLRKRKL